MTSSVSRRVLAVCVGVDKPGVLDPLTAASRGARRFHDWVLGQRTFGVDAHALLFTEKSSGSGKVLRGAILRDMKNALDKGGWDVLYIYLAGHGVALSAYDEKLLLSDAAVDGAEAIHLEKVTRHARYCGVPHIIVIWDACRTYATTDQLRDIEGGSIFQPSDGKHKRQGALDVLLACSRGDSAYEVPKASGANPKNYRAFYTDALLNELDDPDADLVQETSIDGVTISVVASKPLDTCLKEKVPLAALRAKPAFEQIPDGSAASHLPPLFFGIVKSKKTVKSAPPVVVRAAAGSPQLMSEAARSSVSQAFVADRGNAPKGRNAEFERVVDDVQQTIGRDGFETHCGFTIIGAEVRDFTVSNNPYSEFVEWESTQRERHFRVGPTPWGARGGTALFEFANGVGVALAIMPGYVGTVLVDNGQVRNISYAPARKTMEYAQYVARKAEIDGRRAVATAAAAFGKLEELPRQLGNRIARYIRFDKALDPCLGVLAAYAYQFAGNHDQVRDIWRWMSRSQNPPIPSSLLGMLSVPRIMTPVPFDVALLAGHLRPSWVWSVPGVAPCCPWLSPGWGLLDELGAKLHPAVVEAGRQRMPGIWTSFTKRGIAALRSAIRAGEIQ